MIILGSRLSIRQTSYNWKSFAKNAFIVSVDIDPYELNKNLVKIDYKIKSDLRDFFFNFNKIKVEIKNKKNILKWIDWINWCNLLKKNSLQK